MICDLHLLPPFRFHSILHDFEVHTLSLFALLPDFLLVPLLAPSMGGIFGRQTWHHASPADVCHCGAAAADGGGGGGDVFGLSTRRCVVRWGAGLRPARGMGVWWRTLAIVPTMCISLSRGL